MSGIIHLRIGENMFEYQFLIVRDTISYVVGIKSVDVDNAWKVARTDHGGLNAGITLIAQTKLENSTF